MCAPFDVILNPYFTIYFIVSKIKSKALIEDFSLEIIFKAHQNTLLLNK